MVVCGGGHGIAFNARCAQPDSEFAYHFSRERDAVPAFNASDETAGSSRPKRTLSLPAVGRRGDGAGSGAGAALRASPTDAAFAGAVARSGSTEASELADRDNGADSKDAARNPRKRKLDDIDTELQMQEREKKLRTELEEKYRLEMAQAAEVAQQRVAALEQERKRLQEEQQQRDEEQKRRDHEARAEIERFKKAVEELQEDKAAREREQAEKLSRMEAERVRIEVRLCGR